MNGGRDVPIRGIVKRIECENEDCGQPLGDDEALCAECGHQQTTAGWALVLLGLYYPLVALLAGLLALVVVGLLFTGEPPAGALWGLCGFVAAVYLGLAALVVRRYRRRQRNLGRADDVDPFE